MGIDKILKYLSSIFKESKITKSHCEALGEILKQLETKEKRIKSEIDTVSSKQKRKKLNLELKIVKLQLRKGYFKLNALKEESPTTPERTDKPLNHSYSLDF